MKYVWIFAAVVILVRIDVVLKFFDRTAEKIQSSQSVELGPGDIAPGSEVVSLEADLSLKSSPHKKFISMLEDFHISADKSVKEKALELLRSHPTIFTERLDKDLEAAIYRWRDLLMQKNKETYDFLLELIKTLKGENLEMVKRFFSLTIEENIGEFLAAYSKSSDVNCLIMGYLSDPLPEEEKYNELNERLQALDAFLGSDKVNATNKAYAEKCHLVLKLQVDKLRLLFENADAVSNPSPAPTDEAASTPPVAAPAPDSAAPLPGTNP